MALRIGFLEIRGGGLALCPQLLVGGMQSDVPGFTGNFGQHALTPTFNFLVCKLVR